MALPTHLQLQIVSADRLLVNEQVDEVEIPGTMWRLVSDGADQFRLRRPRFSIALDLSGEPWTDFLELRKEHLPREGHRRLISQKLRRTNHAGEPLREIKEMEFSRAEIGYDFGQDPRALGLLEHQLAMQFNAPVFQRLRGRTGQVLTLDPREPDIARWRPHGRPTPPSEADKNAPTPAQGIPLTDPGAAAQPPRPALTAARADG